MSAPILRLTASQRPVFLLNSRLDLFTAALSGFNTLIEHPFSRSYGVILPSSLTRVLPSVLEFSSRLPVSVCGTGTCILTRGFSRQRRIRDFGPWVLHGHSSAFAEHGFAYVPALHASTRTASGALTLPFCVPPSFKQIRGGTGISTCCPSPTPFGLGLGPD